jgi:hypothetical protein
MAEELLAHLVHELERNLTQYKDGKTTIAVVEESVMNLKARIAGIVARYCDDFSSIEYYQHLEQMEGKDATDEER